MWSPQWEGPVLPLVLTGKREGRVLPLWASTSQAEEQSGPPFNTALAPMNVQETLASTQLCSLVLPGDNPDPPVSLRGQLAEATDQGRGAQPSLRLSSRALTTLGWMSCTHRGWYRRYSGHNSYA